MNKVQQTKLVKLREKVVKEAKKKGIKDIDGFCRSVKRLKDPNVLKKLLDIIPHLTQKWYQEIKITVNRTGEEKVELYEKTPKEIGEPLEYLVKVALRALGCEVVPSGTFFKNEFGYWVSDKKRKKLVLKEKIIVGLPSFKEEGKFKNRGIVFTHYLNVKNLVDFESEKIAIEVKNRNPAIPYQTDFLVKRDILDRFKKVRKKKRYLLIAEGVLNDEQRKILTQRKIEEVNLNEQLRRNNRNEVYKSVFYALEQILSTLDKLDRLRRLDEN